MPAPAWEDIGDFFSDDEFAVNAVITLKSGATVSVTGNFDDPYIGARLGEYDNDTDGPTFLCDEKLVRAVRRGDTVAITFPEGVEVFDIMAGAKADGTGLAALELSRP